MGQWSVAVSFSPECVFLRIRYRHNDKPNNACIQRKTNEHTKHTAHGTRHTHTHHQTIVEHNRISNVALTYDNYAQRQYGVAGARSIASRRFFRIRFSAFSLLVVVVIVVVVVVAVALYRILLDLKCNASHFY